MGTDVANDHTKADRPDRPPVLAYVVTEDWYFLSHRLPMALAAKRAGYDVHVITNVNTGRAAMESKGFTVHAVAWRRGSVNPAAVLSNILELRRVFRSVRPVLVHNVALQPSIVGSLAAAGLPFLRLNALAGLGFAFSSNRVKARLVRPVLRILLRHVLGRRRAAVLVQNRDDRKAIEALGIGPEKIFLVAGSGVDSEGLRPLPEPECDFTAAFVGRLLDDKGVRSLIEAHSILARRGKGFRLLLAGAPDPANPVSIPAHEIADWIKRPGIEVLGHVRDVREVWRRAHIAVLPSRREGLPKSLLEAAACGRPIVATDVPGCREIALPDLNALLVPPDDPVALADAIGRLAADSALRRRFGVAGRQLVEERFSDVVVGHQIRALYARLTGQSAGC